MPRYRFDAEASKSPGDSARSTPVSKPDTDPFATLLEVRFPHVLNIIQAMWGYQEMNLYFSKLALNERADREGFPTEVWEDIHMLMQLHIDAFPHLPS